ncbi:MAG TPA: prolyl aminopeptidase [Gammaproteobacteria bacterium]|nr:prolyl aminopeptidase [Gammaproteobacteria bacterium]
MLNINDILYPAIEPYHTELISVSSLHTLYFEECGNPQGKPVLFIHGGPGSGVYPMHRTYFNPNHYRIILVDQRGCGKSTPHAEIRDNTLSALIADFEKIREHLRIDQWMLFGGSWGSTLALAYAQMHPSRVTELVLRGIFLGREKELRFIYQAECGASEVYPDAWEDFIALVPENERHDTISAYSKLLANENKEIQYQAAKAWSVWEANISTLFFNKNLVDTYGDPEFSLAIARIENHYFMHHLFLEANQLLRDVDKIRHIPGVIIHGRYDMCCPVTNAWELHRAWPEAELFIVPDAGHSAGEPGIALQLVKATDRFFSADKFYPRQSHNNPL